MAEEKAKLILFTKELEEVIEADAKRCQRSFVRQVVAVLMTYYNIEDVEINKQRLQILNGLAPKSKKEIPVMEIDLRSKKKKKKVPKIGL